MILQMILKIRNKQREMLLSITPPRQRARSDPRQDLSGQLWALWDSSRQGLAQLIRTGSSGQSGLARPGPAQILQQSQSNSVPCPDWARTWQTGLARSNPGQAPTGLAIWAHTIIYYSKPKVKDLLVSWLGTGKLKQEMELSFRNISYYFFLSFRLNISCKAYSV